MIWKSILKSIEYPCNVHFLDEDASEDLGITGSIEPCEAYLLYNFRPEFLSLPHLSSYENSPEYVKRWTGKISTWRLVGGTEGYH